MLFCSISKHQCVPTSYQPVAGAAVQYLSVKAHRPWLRMCTSTSCPQMEATSIFIITSPDHRLLSFEPNVRTDASVQMENVETLQTPGSGAKRKRNPPRSIIACMCGSLFFLATYLTIGQASGARARSSNAVMMGDSQSWFEE